MRIVDAAQVGKSERILLDLFVQNLRNTLVDEAIKAIRPIVDAKVDRIVAELEPEVQREYDLLKQRTVVHFVVNRRGEKQ